MALSFTHDGRLWIVLDEENVERIQQCDPFDFDGRKALGVMALRVPLQITIAFARKDELSKIQALATTADNLAALTKYLARGFTVTASDHDRPYDVYRSVDEGHRR